MWEQIRSYREQQGPAALRHFKLNILGEVVADFSLPGESAAALTVDIVQRGI